MVWYGQLVIGPPGSGKTTYCEGMKELLEGLGRSVLIVNMDFANDWVTKLQYAKESKGAICQFSAPDVDVRDLMTSDDIMKSEKLGPNGSLIYAYRKLSDEIDWLKTRIEQAKKRKGCTQGKPNTLGMIPVAYVLFDMPGQVELYTIDASLRRILRALNNRDKGFRPVVVHLVDSTLCTKLDHYVSALLLSLSAQMGLELPFLNVFTKVDLALSKDLFNESKLSTVNRERADFSIDFLAKAEDLQYLLPVMHPSAAQENGTNRREIQYSKFHERVLELVEDFSLVSFLPLDIQDKEMCLNVLKFADQANGFVTNSQT